MPIPDYEREVFPKRPLKSAICQVRFNEILSIGTDPPSRFQELVKNRFPKFTRAQSVVLAFVNGQVGPAPTPSVVSQFTTSDDSYVLGLATGSLSLESRGYTEFSDFAELLQVGLDALVAVYAPPTFGRIGLRYVNEVVRVTPEGGRLDWKGWVNEQLVPQFVYDSVGNELQGSGHLLTFRHGDGLVNVRYGFQQGQVVDGRPAEAFTLDMDSFVETEVAPPDAIAKVTAFNRWLYRFFRWAVGNQMTELMRGKQDDKDVIFGAATP